MTMKISRSAVLLALMFVGLGTLGIAAPRQDTKQSTKPAATAQQVDLSQYKTMAEDVLKAFLSGDKAAAKSKAKSLEEAWDEGTRGLRSHPSWKPADDAMDVFIKPIEKGTASDPAAVQSAFEAFIAKIDEVE